MVHEQYHWLRVTILIDGEYFSSLQIIVVLFDFSISYFACF